MAGEFKKRFSGKTRQVAEVVVFSAATVFFVLLFACIASAGGNGTEIIWFDDTPRPSETTGGSGLETPGPTDPGHPVITAETVGPLDTPFIGTFSPAPTETATENNTGTEAETAAVTASPSDPTPSPETGTGSVTGSPAATEEAPGTSSPSETAFETLTPDQTEEMPDATRTPDTLTTPETAAPPETPSPFQEETPPEKTGSETGPSEQPTQDPGGPKTRKIVPALITGAIIITAAAAAVAFTVIAVVSQRNSKNRK